MNPPVSLQVSAGCPRLSSQHLPLPRARIRSALIGSTPPHRPRSDQPPSLLCHTLRSTTGACSSASSRHRNVGPIHLEVREPLPSRSLRILGGPKRYGIDQFVASREGRPTRPPSP